MSVTEELAQGGRCEGRRCCASLENAASVLKGEEHLLRLNSAAPGFCWRETLPARASPQLHSRNARFGGGFCARVIAMMMMMMISSHSDHQYYKIVRENVLNQVTDEACACPCPSLSLSLSGRGWCSALLSRSAPACTAAQGGEISISLSISLYLHYK